MRSASTTRSRCPDRRPPDPGLAGPSPVALDLRADHDPSPALRRAILDLVDEAGRADGVHPLSEHVTLHLRGRVPGEDLHVTAHLDGVLAGYAHLDPTDLVAGPVTELVVRPSLRRRGVGRALLAEVLRLTAGLPRGLRLWAHGAQDAAVGLAHCQGFTEARRLLQMRRSLLAPLPAAPSVPGVRLTTFSPGRDDAEWLRVNAEAFAHHPEQGRWTQADLSARIAESWFDPQGFFLARSISDDTLLGFHWTKVHGGDETHSGAHDPIGEVYVVGVSSAAQGMGLGRALTLRGLQHLRAQGLTQVMLYVDGDNTAARHVYEGLGFTLWDEDVMFYRDLTGRPVNAHGEKHIDRLLPDDPGPVDV